MTNTMNQVKAVELNTAIVDELKTVLGIMTRYNETEDKTEAIEAGYEDVFGFGVCALVMCDLHAIDLTEDFLVCTNCTTDGFTSYWANNFATEDEKVYDGYPVSVGGCVSMRLYLNTEDKWLGEYGKRRLFFLQTLIVFLSERTHKWHMNCIGNFIPFYTEEELHNL